MNFRCQETSSRQDNSCQHFTIEMGQKHVWKISQFAQGPAGCLCYILHRLQPEINQRVKHGFHAVIAQIMQTIFVITQITQRKHVFCFLGTSVCQASINALQRPDCCSHILPPVIYFRISQLFVPFLLVATWKLYLRFRNQLQLLSKNVFK